MKIESQAVATRDELVYLCQSIRQVVHVTKYRTFLTSRSDIQNYFLRNSVTMPRLRELFSTSLHSHLLNRVCKALRLDILDASKIAKEIYSKNSKTESFLYIKKLISLSNKTKYSMAQLAERDNLIKIYSFIKISELTEKYSLEKPDNEKINKYLEDLDIAFFGKKNSILKLGLIELTIDISSKLAIRPRDVSKLAGMMAKIENHQFTLSVVTKIRNGLLSDFFKRGSL